MGVREAGELESAYGDKQRAEPYLQAGTKAAQGVQRLCWNEKHGLIADTPAQQLYSQHANFLGVLLDVIPKQRQREVMTKVLSASDPVFKAGKNFPPMGKASYYYRFDLARPLEQAGIGDRYLE